MDDRKQLSFARFGYFLPETVITMSNTKSNLKMGMKNIIIKVSLLTLFSLIYVSCSGTNPSSSAVPIQNLDMRESATPMNIPSATPAPDKPKTEETPTNPILTTTIPELSPTPTPSATSTTIFNSGIFVWGKNLYGFLTPESEQLYQIDRISPKDSNVLGPASAISLVFSDYSNQVAYLTYQNELVELWVADLSLQNTQKIWSDDENLLGYSSSYDVIKLTWGPGEKFIFLENRSYIIVYNLQEQSYLQLSGPCDHVVVSPTVKVISLLCPLKDDEAVYLVLGQDGNFLKTDTIPEGKVFIVTDWVFSSDGSRILVATPQNELLITDTEGVSLELPAEYTPPRWDVTQRVLQLSQDGSKIFVFGYDQTTNRCPEIVLPCWLVLDAYTGKIIWYPNERTAEGFGASSWDGYGANWDATLSPDGDQVVLFIATEFSQFGIVSSIYTNETHVLVVEFIPIAVKWSK